MTDVVLIDDHPLLTAGLKTRLEGRGVASEIATDLDVEAILRLVEARRPSLAVLDYEIPPLGPSTGLIKPILARGAEVLILTGRHEDALWGSLLAEGAVGVIGKEEPLDDILDAIRDVLAGHPFRVSRALSLRAAWDTELSERAEKLAPFERLSQRESNVLAHLGQGLSPQEIAEHDYVSVETVRSQLKSLFRKLGVSSQLEAVAVAHRAGWEYRTDD